MVPGRLIAYRDRVRSTLETAFETEHSPHDVAASFAAGVFITALPTLGTGLLVFVLLAAISDRVCKLALLASVVVLNPAVKWGVYAASFWLGNRILGPVPGISLSGVSLSAGPDIVARLLVGNLVIAVVFTVVGYAVVLRLVLAFRRRELELGDALPEVGSE
ncbi:DUF2062 domain-containing protein [Natronomonas sp. F2-12]|jgi:uncharacterized protein (DUF2062 family)|uniref:DUF2062 domain-containing protein n=1 Tax=Natronomonas aquatica TaxID=2841590 RepID=A0A9R1CRW9_9EURY|nr:DUF2062 domain-containing protein [Natronomonas aquatica]MCQ4332745.1 DUF2062 domain-containing protein [Natronomonas aquatica]